MATVRLAPRLFMILDPLKMIEFVEVSAASDISDSERVLDLGCGTGVQSLILANRSEHVTGIDIDSSSIATARARARAVGYSSRTEFLCCDILDAKFERGTFDKIVSFSVLEHMPRWIEVLKRIRQWLAYDGKAVITVDSLDGINSSLKEIHTRKFSVVEYFSRDRLIGSLRCAGFSSVRAKPILMSRYAMRLLARKIAEPFGSLHPLALPVEYATLRNEERKAKTTSQNGLFLLAEAES